MKKTVLSLLSLAMLQLPLGVTRAVAQPEEPYDPWEPMNRGIFDFNDYLDVHILEPVARFYKENAPEPVYIGVGNFFSNLEYPNFLVSDIVQGKFTQAWDHTARFLINTTVGVLGFMDFATEWGYPFHDEDFGIALAYHGVPSGPYLVVPLFGPMNVRDGIGEIVDGFINPIGWVGYSSLDDGTKVAIALGALSIRTVQTRAGLLQAIETAKESSVDYYLSVQGAYYQYRHGMLTDGKDDDEDDQFEQPPLPQGTFKGLEANGWSD
jgi:phospholipid-binding lipoprotein MlaA